MGFPSVQPRAFAVAQPFHHSFFVVDMIIGSLRFIYPFYEINFIQRKNNPTISIHSLFFGGSLFEESIRNGIEFLKNRPHCPFNPF